MIKRMGGGIDPATLCCDRLREFEDNLEIWGVAKQGRVMLVLTSRDGFHGWDIPLNFCPFCGKELQVG